jgi:hypothetical protein
MNETPMPWLALLPECFGLNGDRVPVVSLRSTTG